MLSNPLIASVHDRRWNDANRKIESLHFRYVAMASSSMTKRGCIITGIGTTTRRLGGSYRLTRYVSPAVRLFMMNDGVPQQIQLHHSRQQSTGPQFEVTTRTHRAASGAGREALHPFGSQKNPDFPVDRSAFDVDRNQYWKDRTSANQPRNGGCK